MHGVTSTERQTLRHLIDRAKRERLDRSGSRVCGYCGEPFERDQPTQAFCSRSHRKLAWRKTEAGLRYRRGAYRRRKQRDAVAG